MMRFQDLPVYDILYSEIFSYLDWLSLRNLMFTNSTFEKLVTGYFEYASELNFRPKKNGQSIDYETFIKMTRRSISLRVLKFPKGQAWLNNSLVIPILKNNPKLVDLGMEDTRLDDEASILVLCVNNKLLETLRLDDCSWLTSVGLEILFNRLTSGIRQLSLARVAIDDKVVSMFFRRFVNLENVNITGCWRLTNRSLIFLKEYCPSLKVIVCLQCPNLNDVSTFNELKSRGVTVVREMNANCLDLKPFVQQMPNLQI